MDPWQHNKSESKKPNTAKLLYFLLPRLTSLFPFRGVGRRDDSSPRLSVECHSFLDAEGFEVFLDAVKPGLLRSTTVHRQDQYLSDDGVRCPFYVAKPTKSSLTHAIFQLGQTASLRHHDTRNPTRQLGLHHVPHHLPICSSQELH